MSNRAMEEMNGDDMKKRNGLKLDMDENHEKILATEDKNASIPTSDVPEKSIVVEDDIAVEPYSIGSSNTAIVNAPEVLSNGPRNEAATEEKPIPIDEPVLLQSGPQPTIEDEVSHCPCGREPHGVMVTCDSGRLCPRKRFHIKCVSLRGPPPGKWYCARCRDIYQHKPKPIDVLQDQYKTAMEHYKRWGVFKLK